MRYKMIFSYDGTLFFGYQKQLKERTIQEEIETRLSLILNQNITIYASGRTDKGVHALNQVAIFDCEKELDCNKILHSLNKMLPRDIHIKILETCEADFHARFSALSKEYIYLFSLKENNPLKNRFINYLNKELDLKLIRKGMKLFLGKHNFQNFCSNKEELSYEEEIYAFSLKKKDDFYILSIKGSGFKRYMVRMIVGTLFALGLHKITLLDISKYLNGDKRNIVSFKAEPNGLILKEVYYKKEQENA